MKRYVWSLFTVATFCGFTMAYAGEPKVNQEAKTSQLYYQHGVNSGYYPQQYGYSSQFNPLIRPTSSQVCIPGVGCGTFYNTSVPRVNNYGNVSCGPNGCYVNQQLPANYGCPNGQCGMNQGYYPANTGNAPFGAYPAQTLPGNYGAPVNYGYPQGSFYNQPVFPQQNNYGVQYLPMAPERVTPVSPYNYIVEGKSQALKTDGVSSAGSKPAVNTNIDSPYFK